MATTSVAENHHTDRKQPRAAAAALAGPLVLALICCAIFWKLVLTDQYTWLEGPDLANQVLPWYQFQAGEWHAGRFPLWDPYQWAGQPLLGQAQPGGAYPLNWVLFSLPLKNGWIRQTYLHWYFVIIHYMGALFAYWLCRDLKLHKIPSILGGAVFAFSGFMGSIDWPQMLNGAIWAPLVFLFLLRAGRGYKPLAGAALSGSFLGMAWLSGHHQAPIFLTLASGAAWTFFTLRYGRVRWRIAGLAALSLGFAVCCGALQLLPAYEYGKLAHRWVGADEPVTWKEPVPYPVHDHYSLRLSGLFGIVFAGFQSHTATFSGIVAFSLAVLAAAALWRDFRVRFFALLGLGALFAALGSNSVVHGLIYALLPAADKARSPSAAAYLFSFAVAILAAIAINVLFNDNNHELIGKYSKYILLFSVLVLLFSFGLAAARTAGPGDDRIILTALFGLLLAGACAACGAGHLAPRAAAICCLVLALLELGNFATNNLPHRQQANRSVYLAQMSRNADIVEFLRAQPGPFRVEVDDQEIPFNFGDWHGIEARGGYLASLSSNLYRADLHGETAGRLMNVLYSVRRNSDRSGQREVFTGSSGLKVFENAAIMPRAWAVHEVEQAVPGESPSARFSTTEFDITGKAIVNENPPSLEKCAGKDHIQILNHISNGTSLLAQMPCRGFVILADTYFPGWRAKVDGKPAKIYETYGAFRGVVVDAGVHYIEMRYRPWSVISGAILTALGFLAAATLQIASLQTGRTVSNS